MTADITAQEGIFNVVATGGAQDILNGPADIARRIHQRAIHVEEINRKCRNLWRVRSAAPHAGCGPPSSMLGTRLPVSGLITCCVPSPGGGCKAASVFPSIS